MCLPRAEDAGHLPSPVPEAETRLGRRQTSSKSTTSVTLNDGHRGAAREARQHAAEGDDMTKDEEGGLQSQVLLRPSVAGDAADWCRSRRHDERALGTGQHHETKDSTQQGAQSHWHQREQQRSRQHPAAMLPERSAPDVWRVFKVQLRITVAPAA